MISWNDTQSSFSVPVGYFRTATHRGRHALALRFASSLSSRRTRRLPESRSWISCGGRPDFFWGFVFSFINEKFQSSTVHHEQFDDAARRDLVSCAFWVTIYLQVKVCWLVENRPMFLVRKTTSMFVCKFAMPTNPWISASAWQLASIKPRTRCLKSRVDLF